MIIDDKNTIFTKWLAALKRAMHNGYMREMDFDKAFLIGFSALVAWATSAALIAGLTNIPPLEGLAITLAIAFVLSIMRLTLMKRWHLIKAIPPKPALLAGVAMIGNHMGYFLSFSFAPAVEVDLIFYSWPLISFVVLLARRQMRFHWHALWAIALGFLALILVSPTLYPTSGYSHPYLGWLIAMMGTLCWVVYSFCAQNIPKAPIEIIGLYAGGSMVLTCLLSAPSTWMLPNLADGLRLLALGIIVYTLGYWGWDYALKQGKLGQLTLVANITPLLSVYLLCLFGYATWSWQIIAASLLLATSLSFVRKMICTSHHN